MSWLKEKLFGQKPRLGSCCNLEIYESQGNSNAQYCQTQLKNFIERGQELKAYIMGYEVVSDVSYTYSRKNMFYTRWLSPPSGKIMSSIGDTKNS